MSKRDEFIKHLSRQAHITENHIEAFKNRFSEVEFEKLNNISYDLKLFNSAEEYRRSAEYLISGTPDGTSQINFNNARAYVLCLSFSLELYVKCLLEIKRKRTHGHRITELFRLLDGKTKEGLCRLYSLRTRTPSLTVEEFKEIMKEVDNIFVEWRYVHEKEFAEFINIQLLWNMINCFGEYIVLEKNKNKAKP